MTQYIDKSAVVAEIEKIIADETESIKSFEHSKNVSEVQRSNARMGVLMHIRSLLNTIEVKEVQEEPVSEDLEQAAIDYCSGNKGADARVRAGFIEGAKWKEEQLEKEKGRNNYGNN